MAGTAQGSSLLILSVFFSALESDITEGREEEAEDVGIVKERCEIVT